MRYNRLPPSPLQIFGGRAMEMSELETIERYKPRPSAVKMVETRKGKIETREGTTTDPDSEIHIDYIKVFENDQPYRL